MAAKESGFKVVQRMSSQIKLQAGRIEAFVWAYELLVCDHGAPDMKASCN